MPETLAQRVRAKYPGVYDDLSDSDLDAKVRAKYPGVYDDLPKSSPERPQPGSKAAIIMQATSKALPVAETAALNLATSPAVPRMTAAAGRVIGGVAPVLGGAVKMGPAGAAIGAAGAAQGAWAGGKAGWFTGKLAQQLMTPVAKVLEVVKPYAQTLGTLSGAQGALDLAQMAEPNRTDIGTLGMTMGNGRSDAERKDHPAIINQLLQDKMADAQAWDAFMRDYPQTVGKSRWSALKPSERLDGFKQFLHQQTSGASDIDIPQETK